MLIGKLNMQYYNNEIEQKYPNLLNYFKNGIKDDNKSISHCLLFWGADITSQCELALEIARLLNCNENGDFNCNCLNCRWIREQTHPAVKIYTRLDFKENDTASDDSETTKGKKNININQAKAIINELSVTSDYHRVYIFCDRDENGNLLPLNQINFPEATSNALLKTFEEPPTDTTFIFLTKDKNDVISTVVSRAQSFFVPADNKNEYNHDLVDNTVQNYWNIDKQQVLSFEENLYQLANDNDPIEILEQFQNYILETIKSNLENKHIFYKLTKDLSYIEDAKRQLSLTPSMHLRAVIENLCFKIIL